MQIELRIRNTDLIHVLKSYAERRLRFTLSRFGDRTGQVVVIVSELESADDGIATSCHISADIRPFGQVAARETAPDLYAAIDRAAAAWVACLPLGWGEQRMRYRSLGLLVATPEERSERNERPLRSRDGCCDRAR